VCCRNRVLAAQLVKLGAVDVLAAIVASREPGARPRVRQDVPKDSKLVLAAAIALTQIAEWEEHRRHLGKLAFLRSIIALTRSADTRIQLAGVSILASLAPGASGGTDLRESCRIRRCCAHRAVAPLHAFAAFLAQTQTQTRAGAQKQVRVHCRRHLSV
jgi:hypothetical protein